MRFHRYDEFFGQTLRHGEVGSVTLLRLARRDFGQWHGKVHEQWRGEGRVVQSIEPLMHAPHPTLSDFFAKIARYSAQSDASRFVPTPALAVQTIIFPCLKFLQNYCLRQGFRDGWRGFILAYMMSLHSLHVRIFEYERRQR